MSKAAIGLKEELKEARVAGIIPHQAGRGAAGGTPVSITDALDSGAIEDTADIALPIQFRERADVPRQRVVSFTR